MDKKTLQRLLDIEDHLSFAIEISKGLTLESLKVDRTLRFALERALEIVGEAVKHVPEDVRATYPSIP
jgi:uncharacterized protein with HEPN domain